MVWWMKYQIWTPIFLLQILNLFWYFLILRIGYRYVPVQVPTATVSRLRFHNDRAVTVEDMSTVGDVRSDEEDYADDKDD